MSDPEFVVLECVIEKTEMRSVLIDTARGPEEGYQWRHLLLYPFDNNRNEWTPWVFGSNKAVDHMLQKWQDFLATRGHLAKSIPPDTTAH